MPAVKDVGEPGAGEPHARFDEAAGGIWHQSGSHTPHGVGASRRPYRDPSPLALLLCAKSASRGVVRRECRSPMRPLKKSTS
jgi:hypothetical protein